jgi:hypothetical protein
MAIGAPEAPPPAPVVSTGAAAGAKHGHHTHHSHNARPAPPPGAYTNIDPEVLKRHRAQGGIKQRIRDREDFAHSHPTCPNDHTLTPGAHPVTSGCASTPTFCTVCHLEHDRSEIAYHCPFKTCAGLQVCRGCYVVFEAEITTALIVPNHDLHSLARLLPADSASDIGITVEERNARVAVLINQPTIRLDMLAALSDQVRRHAPTLVHPDVDVRLQRIIIYFLPAPTLADIAASDPDAHRTFLLHHLIYAAHGMAFKTPAYMEARRLCHAEDLEHFARLDYSLKRSAENMAASHNAGSARREQIRRICDPAAAVTFQDGPFTKAPKPLKQRKTPKPAAAPRPRKSNKPSPTAKHIRRDNSADPI